MIMVADCNRDAKALHGARALRLTFAAALAALWLAQPVLAQEGGTSSDAGMGAETSTSTDTDGGDTSQGDTGEDGVGATDSDDGGDTTTDGTTTGGEIDADDPAGDAETGLETMGASGSFDDGERVSGGVSGGEVEDDGIVGLIEAPKEDAPYSSDALRNSFVASPSAPAAQARRMGPMMHPPVVVELFTSQGCSSCPPADEMMNELADNPDVLTLSWHVDYWDYLGWADEFARPEFTLRQQAYARAVGERSVYTPQVIIGGTDTLIGLRPADLLSVVDAQMARPVALSVNSVEKDDGYQIELTPRAPARRDIAILLIRYAPKRELEIKAGENRGLTMVYRNVVLAVDPVARWNGRAPVRLTVRPDPSGKGGSAYPDDTRHAIIAQQLGEGKDAQPTGPIMAAIRLD